MPDDEVQEPLHPLDAADVSPDPPWPALSLDEPLGSDVLDPELASLELSSEFRRTPELPGEDNQQWVRQLDIAPFSQATSLEDGPLEDISLDQLPTTIWNERIGERADPVPSSSLEDLSLDSLPTMIWPDQTGEPADPVLIASAGPARSLSLEGGLSAKGRWRLSLQRGTFQLVGLIALAGLALSGMYLSDRRGDDSALNFPSSDPGPVIAAQGVRPPTTVPLRGSIASPPGSAPSDVLVALGVGGAVSEPAEAGARNGIAPRSGVFGPMPASPPAGGGAVGALPSGAGSPTRPANPAAPAAPATSPAAQTPAPATSAPASQSAAPVTSPPASQSGEPATPSPTTQRPAASPPAAVPSDTSPVDPGPDLRPVPTAPPARSPVPTSPPATDPPATSPPPTSPPATSPPRTSPPATSPPPTSPPATSPSPTSPPPTSPPVTEPPAPDPGGKSAGKQPPGGDNPGKGHPDGKPGGPG